MDVEELNRQITNAVVAMHEANRRAREQEWPWRLPEEDYAPDEGILNAIDKEWSAFIARGRYV